MRQITQEAVTAFINDVPFKKGNMRIIDGTMYLHGNAIARKLNPAIRGLADFEITNAGWTSSTTKERLNGLPGVSICQRKFQWYLNNQPWDGEWTSIINPDNIPY